MPVSFASIGGTAAPPPPAPPPQSGSIDFSGIGGTSAPPPGGAPPPPASPPSAPTQADPDAPDTGSLWQTAKQALSDLHDAVGEGQKGVIKGAMQTVGGALQIAAAHVGGAKDQGGDWTTRLAYKYAHPEATDAQVEAAVNGTGGNEPYRDAVTRFEHKALQASADWINRHAQTHNVFQQLGSAGEGIAEFLTPEALEKLGLTGAAKTAEIPGTVDRLQASLKAAKILKDHPVIAKLVGIGARALQAGGGAGAQTYLKTGGDEQAAGDAATLTAAFGPVLEGGGEAATALAEHVAPRVMKIGGVEFPILRSQEENPSALQEFAAKANDKGTARVQNEAGQQVIENAAKKATETNLGEVNKSLARETSEEAYMRKRFGAGTPEEQEAAQAAKQIDTQAAVKRTRNLVDAADELKASAQGIDERLGAATDGKYKDLQRDLRDAEERAFYAGDEGREAAEKDVDAIRDRLDNYFTASGNTNTGDMAARNQAWHRQYILRDAGNAIESSFNLTPGTASEVRVNRFFDPKQAQARLTRVERKVDAKYGKGYFASTIGPDALKNMHTVFHYMAESPSTAANANRGLSFIGKVLAGESIAGAAGHVLGGHGPLAAGGLAVTLAGKKALHAIATDPKIAQQFIYAMKYARPKVAAPLIAQMIRENAQEDRQQQQSSEASQDVKIPAPAQQEKKPTFITPSYGGKLAPGMIEQGNIDLGSRPNIKNPDGSHSSVFSMGFNVDGKEVLVPGVGDGSTYPLRQLTEKEALDQYKRTGKHLGKFADPASSDAYAETLHEDQERGNKAK